MYIVLHCMLTDGGKVVSSTYRPRSSQQKNYFSAFFTNLSQRLSKHEGLVWP
jgi:hypothetical protein